MSDDPRIETIRDALSRHRPPQLRRGEMIRDLYALADDALAALDSLAADLARTREALAAVRRWYEEEPWKGSPDPGSFGGHPYSDNERAIGYGSYRDPRFLPAALRAGEGEQGR